MFDTHLTTAIASLWRLERFSQPHKAATNDATDDDEGDAMVLAMLMLAIGG